MAVRPMEVAVITLGVCREIHREITPLESADKDIQRLKAMLYALSLALLMTSK